MSIPIPKFPVSGVACIVRLPPKGASTPANSSSASAASPKGASKKVFLVEGDRHFLSGTHKKAWEAIFHPAFEEAGKSVIKGAPPQVITVKENLEFLGKTYGPIVQAGAIAEYCVSKKIFPKCCFTQEAALQIAKQESYAYTIETSQLLKFHAQLMDFTARVAGDHYYENIFGAVDGAPTMDVNTILATLYREGHEEFNLSLELLRNAEFLCYGNPRRNKAGETVVTAYFIASVDEQVMLDAWQAKMLRDRPTGNEWRCPLSWYKFLGDIDLAAAECAKAHLETGPAGGWYPMGVHPKMDRKNREFIELYTEMRVNAPQPMHSSGSSIPRKASPPDSAPASEPASKRQRENPEEDPEEDPEEHNYLTFPTVTDVDGLGDVNARAAPVPGSLDEFVADTLAGAARAARAAGVGGGFAGGGASLGIFDPAASPTGTTSVKMRLHLMVNDGSVTPLLPQGDEPKLPSHPVPLGTEGFYMGEPAVVTYYDETLPSQYAPAGHECLLTVNWEGGQVRIPKTAFFRELDGGMWE